MIFQPLAAPECFFFGGGGAWGKCVSEGVKIQKKNPPKWLILTSFSSKGEVGQNLQLGVKCPHAPLMPPLIPAGTLIFTANFCELIGRVRAYHASVLNILKYLDVNFIIKIDNNCMLFDFPSPFIKMILHKKTVRS